MVPAWILGLLIDTEDHGVGGRIDIQADDVADLGSELRIVGVNADSIFPTCAEVKFPSWRVPMISRLGDRLLHSLVADRGDAAVVLGLAR